MTAGRVTRILPAPTGIAFFSEDLVFRNVRFYRLSSPWPESENELSEKLASASFTPCSAYAERSSGWEPPAGEAETGLCRRVEGADLLRLRSQSRLLPAAAIADALEARLLEYRERAQQEPSRREVRKLKQQTRDELLPKALLKSERTTGLVIPLQGLIAIDTLSDNRCERFLDHLRAPLGRLEVAPLTFKRPVGELLTEIFLGEAPRGIILGSECRMQDPADPKAQVRCMDIDLADATVRKHVRDGMRLTHLGIEFGNVLSCVIDQNGNISKLKLTGLDSRDEAADEDPLARLDAEFVLLTGTLRQLLATLDKALGGKETAPAAAVA